MRRIIRFLLPPLILLAGIAFAANLISNKPKTVRQRPAAAKPVVEILVLQPQNYKIEVPSRGTVSARTETDLTAEVAGRVTQISPDFYNGGFFEAGELLLQIDPRDYQNAVTIARAEMTLRQVALAEEQARSKQARIDWDKMNFSGEPDPLLLRAPQLENAEASLAAAGARFEQAKIDLERTRITAPYAGRILQKNVDAGQYLTRGKEVARIYASDALEVRLPLTDEQLRYISLPEDFRHDNSRKPNNRVPVELSLKRGDRNFNWQASLVRTEGAVDSASRQLFVIAEVKDPYLRKGDRPQLKIGQFVDARISGETLENVFIIPRSAVHDGSTVHVIGLDNRLSRRKLNILWRDSEHVVASGPLEAEERISLTKLPFAADGIEVRPAGEQPRSGGKKGKKKKKEAAQPEVEKS